MKATLTRERVATGAGLVAVASLAITTAILWPGLEVRYHLMRLEKEPTLFEELFVSESGPQRKAAIDFLRQPRGRQALFELYLAEFDRTEPSWSTRDALLRWSKDSAQKGVLALWEEKCHVQVWTGPTGHSSSEMAIPPLDRRRRMLVIESLGACVGATFRVPGLDRLEFQVQPAAGGRVDQPAWPTPGDPRQGVYPSGAPSVPAEARFACFFRVVPPASASP